MRVLRNHKAGRDPDAHPGNFVSPCHGTLMMRLSSSRPLWQCYGCKKKYEPTDDGIRLAQYVGR